MLEIVRHKIRTLFLYYKKDRIESQTKSTFGGQILTYLAITHESVKKWHKNGSIFMQKG